MEIDTAPFSGIEAAVTVAETNLMSDLASIIEPLPLDGVTSPAELAAESTLALEELETATSGVGARSWIVTPGNRAAPTMLNQND